ncbi:MAG: hypothetical protein EXQ95_14555 [Alphaproteobacteria bacterium]|nr:hypothetical protein [Alphaproteobacteria bacterium]
MAREETVMKQEPKDERWRGIPAFMALIGFVALVVKATAKAAGLDPAKYAGHSLRAGLATSAAAAGASERSIMAQTGHKSVVMARRYIRSGEVFRENAAAVVGL